MLRSEIWKLGCRFRKDVASLPGRPDIVFPGARLVVFCDGDFWHGRNWQCRRRKLAAGANADYWLAKIRRNMDRDQLHTRTLERSGWLVLRYWEGDIHQDSQAVARDIFKVLRRRRKSVLTS